MSGRKKNAARDDAPGPPAIDADTREYHAMRGRKANRAAYLLIIPNQDHDDRFWRFTRLSGRRRCPSSSHHILGDCRLADLDAELEQFTVDPQMFLCSRTAAPSG
jgi:hypothetical protein